jgi:predicted DNA-binding protein (MmcQ/YjbR family)
MSDQTKYITIASSFPGVEESPHFDKKSFRIAKKIFATLDTKTGVGCVKLSEVDQSAFSAYDASIVYAVPNKWGKQGWTNIDVHLIKDEALEDILKTAYCHVAPKKWSALVNQ